MDKETAKAWGEQQAREIKNLKAMKKNERHRSIKIINNEIKQWDDYHVLKALGRVKALINKRFA